MTDTLTSAPRLLTPRLVLRPFEICDAEALARGIGNFDVTKWLSTVPYPYGRSDAEAYIAAQVDAPLNWAISMPDNGLIGGVGIRDGELGYWLARPAWGQGFGFEAARAAVAHWFKDARNGDLRAGYFPGNENSGLLLKCLGFVPDGTKLKTARALSQDIVSNEMRLTRAAWNDRQRFDVRTARLRLRPLERTDAHALVDIATPEVARMLSSLPEDLSVSAAKAFINKRRWQGQPGFLLAIDGPEGEMIGCIGCGGDPVTAMMFLGKEHWGRGFAGEAATCFVSEVFKRLPLNTLYAERFAENTRVAGVIEGLGFKEIAQHEGRVEPRLVVQYRLRRDVFQA